MLVTLQRSEIIKNYKSIVFEIKTLDNMINRKIITDTKQTNIPFGLSPVQIKILHYLYLHPKDTIYQRDIERVIESRRSTTSGILNTMEKNNLIKRLNSQTDARSKQIILTNYSLELSKKMLKQKEDFEAKIQESITKKELEIYFKVTDKIKNNIIKMK